MADTIAEDSPWFVTLLYQCGCGKCQCSHDSVEIYGPYKTKADANKIALHKWTRWSDEQSDEDDRILLVDVMQAINSPIEAIPDPASSSDSDSWSESNH